jgi:hypothetical protein
MDQLAKEDHSEQSETNKAYDKPPQKKGWDAHVDAVIDRYEYCVAQKGGITSDIIGIG